MNREPGPVVHPTRSDPLIGWLSEGVGGRRGAHAGPGSRWRGWSLGPSTVAVLVAVAAMMLAVLTRQPCRRTLWASPGQFTNACYSDIPTVFFAAGLSDRLPYVTPAPDGSHLTQPVGTGALLHLLGVLTPGGPQELRWVFDAGAVLVTVAALAVVLFVGQLSGRRRWDAVLVASGPVLVFTGLVSLDLVAVALAVAGVWAISRDRPVLAGALLGLSAAVRPTAVVVLIALALVQWRRPGLGLFPRVAAMSLLTWSVLNLPVAIASPSGWGAYWTQLTAGRIGNGSLWALPGVVAAAIQQVEGRVPAPPWWLGAGGLVLVVAYAALLLVLPAPDRELLMPVGRWGMLALAGLVTALPVLTLAAWVPITGWIERTAPRFVDGRPLAVGGFLLTTALVAWWVNRAPRPPRLPSVVVLLLAGYTLAAPAVPVQSALWLLPFAVLAVPSWRDLLLWGAAETFATTITWFHLYGAHVPDRGAPPWVYALALFARFAGIALLAWQAGTQAWWTSEDPVRRGGADDPCLPAGPTGREPGRQRVDWATVPTADRS